MTGPIHNADGVRDLIRQACERAGSQAEFAQQAGVSTAFLSNVLAGRRSPGAKLLRLIGLERIVYYQAIS